MKILIQDALDELRKFADKDRNADVTISYTNDKKDELPTLKFKVFGAYGLEYMWSSSFSTLEEAIDDWKSKVNYPESRIFANKFIEN